MFVESTTQQLWIFRAHYQLHSIEDDPIEQMELKIIHVSSVERGKFAWNSFQSDFFPIEQHLKKYFIRLEYCELEMYVNLMGY